MIFNIKDKQINIDRQVIFVCTILTVVLLTFYYFIATKIPNGQDVVLTNDSTQTGSSMPISEETPAPVIEEISIYVRGCVNNPGIVKIKKGDMIADALDKAGGTTIDADLDNINMVYVLNENTMIIIHEKGYIKSTDKIGKGTKSYEGDAVEIQKETDAVIFGESHEGPGQSIAIVNINTATPEELDTLPGIGPKKAADIIRYRTEKGSFKKNEDIMEVSGIGEAAYAKIKDNICIK